MKFSFRSVIALPILISLITISCKKADNPTCSAGAGGNVEVVVFALHNGDTIINSFLHPDTAYVKYGTTTSPGISPSSFDTYYVSEGGEDHIHLTNLHCGSYYIYRSAFDSTSNTRYTGSLGLAFSKTSGEVDTVIHVN